MPDTIPCGFSDLIHFFILVCVFSFIEQYFINNWQLYHLKKVASRSLTTRISRSQIVDILKRPSVGEKIEVKGTIHIYVVC